MTEEIVKAIWGSPAGRSRMTKVLVPMIPEHKTYVEPFAGSAAVMFAKDVSSVEVVNDLDPEIAATFRGLSTMTNSEFNALARKNWVGSKARFGKLLKSKPGTKVEKIYKFLYLQRFSYGRGRKTFSPPDEGKKSTVISKIAKQRDRLKRLKVRSGDYEKVVREFDGPNTFFFFDPPYVGYKAGGGGVGEADFDEQRFVDVLKSLKGKFLVTYGARGDFSKLLKGSGYYFSMTTTPRPMANARGAKKDKVIHTAIVTNYKRAKAVKKSVPSLRVADPGHLVSRLASGDVAGMLSKSDRAALLEKDFLLVGKGEAFGVVQLRTGVRFPTGKRAVESLGEKIDKDTAQRFRSEKSKVWFHSLALREQFDPPRSVAKADDTKKVDPSQIGSLSPDDLRKLLQMVNTEWMQRGQDAPDLVRGAALVVEELRRRGEETPDLPIVREAGKVVKAEIRVRTGTTNGHTHVAVVDSETGNGVTEVTNGHRHRVQDWVAVVAAGHTHTVPKPALEKQKEGDQIIATTSADAEHFHFALVDRNNGNGVTSVDDEHHHHIEDWKVGESDGHRHELKHVRTEGPDQGAGPPSLTVKVSDDIVDTDKPEKHLDTSEGEAVPFERSLLSEAGVATTKNLSDLPFVKQLPLVKMIKADELRYVLGIVLEPNDGDDGNPLDPDAQQDIYSEEDVRKAAWLFMAKYRDLGLMHERDAQKREMEVVESYVAPADFTVGDQKIRQGTWLLGAVIHSDEIWKKVKRGEIAAWSVDGEAVRAPVAA